jgi:isocitrate/isopropylmalate dehydrogenase
MPAKIPITVAHGDGTGPEVMAATLQILEASGAARMAGMPDAFDLVVSPSLYGDILSDVAAQIAPLGRVSLSLRNFDGKAGYALAQGQ